MRNYSMGFVFDDKFERVLLLRKTKPYWQRGLLNAPGGHIEEYESPLDCVVREFEEETDIYLAPPLWKKFLVLKGFNAKGFDFTLWVFYSYMATLEGREPYETEEGVTELIDVKKVLSQDEETMSNLPWMISMALFDDQYVFEVCQEKRTEKPFRVYNG